MEIWKLIVYGKVQGVFYRDSVYQFIHGNIIDVKGHVKNLSNGSVEVVLQGMADDLRRVEDFCYEGSTACNVNSVDKLVLIQLEEFSDFVIEY